jgi:hypothetical protein
MWFCACAHPSADAVSQRLSRQHCFYPANADFLFPLMRLEVFFRYHMSRAGGLGGLRHLARSPSAWRLPLPCRAHGRVPGPRAPVMGACCPWPSLALAMCLGLGRLSCSGFLLIYCHQLVRTIRLFGNGGGQLHLRVLLVILEL